MILPVPIQTYFNANARQDLDAMAAPFAVSAIVDDEHRRHQGKPAIRAWIQESTIAVAAVAVPQAIVSQGEAHEVTAQVSGAFPSSPATLRFRFVLDGDRIVRLAIA